MSPTRHDVRRLLEDIGASDPPPARPGFVAALEDQLRAAAGDVDRGVDVPPAPVRRRWLVPAASAASVAAAVAVIVALVSALTPDADPDPNRLAIVPPASTTSTAPAPGAVESPVTTAASSKVARPRVTVPVITPTTRSTPTTSQNPTTTTAPSDPQTMALRAERDLQGVHLWWSPYTGADFSSYLCLRADAPNRPTYPADANTRAVWRTSDQAEDYYTDRTPPGGEASYLMVAIDRNGRELARSNVVTVPALAPAASP